MTVRDFLIPLVAVTIFWSPASAGDIRADYEEIQAGYAGSMIPSNCVVRAGVPNYPNAAKQEKIEGWVFVTTRAHQSAPMNGIAMKGKVKFINATLLEASDPMFASKEIIEAFQDTLVRGGCDDMSEHIIVQGALFVLD